MLLVPLPTWKMELDPNQQKMNRSEHDINTQRLAQPLGISGAKGLSSSLHVLKNDFLPLLLVRARIVVCWFRQ